MNPALQHLQQASNSMLYISESEFPFEVVELGAVSTSIEEKLLELTGKAAATAVEQVPLAQFFAPLVKTYAGANAEQGHTAGRFGHLQQVLQEELAEVTAYKVGKVQVDVFLVGRLQDGKYGGLRTRSVET